MSSPKKYRAVFAVDLDECTLRYLPGVAPFMAAATGRPVEEFTEPPYYCMVKSNWVNSRREFQEIHGGALIAGEVYANLEAYENASKVLHELIKEGFQIVIVTARFVNNKQHAEVLRQTGLSLDKQDIPYHDICFLSNKALFKADVYLDDSPDNIVNIQNAGGDILIMDQSYNRDIEGQRVYDWEQIGATLREKFPPLD